MLISFVIHISLFFFAMEDIVLNEEDVPGASFTKDPEEYSVVNLKRWLECHGLKQTGKKQFSNNYSGLFKYEITPEGEVLAICEKV